MKLIDSNILIYAGEQRYAPILLPFVADPTNCASVISRIETLGFTRITPKQIIFFESLFKILKVFPVDGQVIEKAIEVRQLVKLSLGDSLIAATALLQNVELVNRNTADFAGIPNLKVINPIP
jgi:predicted nucleic acid-binding protein